MKEGSVAAVNFYEVLSDTYEEPSTESKAAEKRRTNNSNSITTVKVCSSKPSARNVKHRSAESRGATLIVFQAKFPSAA